MISFAASGALLTHTSKALSAAMKRSPRAPTTHSAPRSRALLSSLVALGLIWWVFYNIANGTDLFHSDVRMKKSGEGIPVVSGDIRCQRALESLVEGTFLESLVCS